MMAAINFANACMSASAQPDCVAFACPATTNIAIILDVSLLLASILIILPLAVVVRAKNEQAVRIATRFSNSLPTLRTR